MRNLLALIGAALVTFAGLGWYLGWYKLDPTPSHVTIDIDPKKVNTDLHKGEQKLEHALDAAKGDTTKAPQAVTAPIKAVSQ